MQTLKSFDDDHISQVCDVCIFCKERWLAAAIDKFGASLMVRDEEAAVRQFHLNNLTQYDSVSGRCCGNLAQIHAGKRPFDPIKLSFS